MDDNFLPHSHLLRIVASYFLTAFGMEVQVGISGPGFTHSVVGYFYCLIPGFPPSADKPTRGYSNSATPWLLSRWECIPHGLLHFFLLIIS